MLNKFLRKLNAPKPKRRHLKIQIATVYNSNPTPSVMLTNPASEETSVNKPEINLSKTPTIDEIHSRAGQHPAFKNAIFEVCHLNKGTLLVGFDKPKKIDTHVIVYPEQVYRSEKWYDLAERAQKFGVKIGIFQLRADNKCIEITQNEQSFYLVDRNILKLRHWSIIEATDGGSD